MTIPPTIELSLSPQPDSTGENRTIPLTPVAGGEAVEAPPAVAPPAEPKVEDSNPDELYNFDGAKENTRQHRSVRNQTALAEYYNDRMRDLAELEDKINLLAGQTLHIPEKNAIYQKALYTSRDSRSKFETYWFQQNFGKALEAYEASKDTLMQVIFDPLPPSPVEGRAIWLDRGSIVKAGSPEALRVLVRRIAASGFNIIYFETVNAGYPIYPSHLLAQNPQTKGWDPLAVAVDEAHKEGLELHAWVWTFAVGNTRHNAIIGQSPSYPGPILSKPELATEALQGRGGMRVPPDQFEYWVSPASPKARAFLTSLFSEIVKTYPVDGLQLDYIRYPFQKPGIPMGLEPFAAERFTAETGMSLTPLDDYTLKAWSAWKAYQVSTFVRDVSKTLKSINPNLKLSAAVFPMARYGRMTMIQQDWETWVRNGWIDTLSPMAYSKSPRSLERLVTYIHNMGDNKTLVYPGLSLIKLNAIDLLSVLEVCRQNGVMGTTLFAVAQFDGDKQLVLQRGPYKQRRTLPPHRNPLGASTQMVGDTLGVVQRLLGNDPSTPGFETLKQVEISLKNVERDLTGLNAKRNPTEVALYISSARDDSRLLARQTEQWAEWSSDPVVRYQAKVLKQLVERLVRLVNFTTYQLEPAGS